MLSDVHVRRFVSGRLFSHLAVYSKLSGWVTWYTYCSVKTYEKYLSLARKR